MGAFRMPSLGADMDVGTVTHWLIKPGDRVQRGDIVAVVDTEKSTIEVEIFESGVVDSILVGEGEEVAVGTPLAQISTNGKSTARTEAPRRPQVAIARRSPVTSPVVRRLAEKLGVDLATVAGSGAGGKVTRADVERATRLLEAEPEVAEAALKISKAEPQVAETGAALRRLSASARPPEASRAARPCWSRASPLARRIAAEKGVDLSTVRGSGPRGAVVAADLSKSEPSTRGAGVPRSRPAPEEEPAGGRESRDRQAAMRRAIGNLMARSKREIPHYYLSTTIDMSAAAGWIERTNLDRSVAERLVLPVLLIKAVGRAVAAVPEMNGFMIDDSFVPSPAVHVGVAISLRQGGVIAPAIHDVDQLPLSELMKALRDLVGRARSGSLRSSEMSDPTITVTNLGDLGVESVFGVIYPPQVALVGFGRVTDRPWAQDGLLGVRPCLTATLSADHRASDGHRGGRFLAEIERLLHNPEEL